MKRDLDLYRNVLLAMEDSKYPLDASALTDAAHDYATVSEHIVLMAEDGLVDATYQRDMSGRLAPCVVNRIRGRGYDYLDAVRDDDVWSQVRLKVAQTMKSVPLEVVKSVAVSVITARLAGGAS